MTTTITICSTCRHMGRDLPEGAVRDGERLAEKVARLVPENGDLRVRRVACLMGCDHGCNVAIQAEGKLSYVLGRFAPEEEAARAILAYAALHAASPSGQVPFRAWPQGVKGHFVARIPPLDIEGEDKA